ncbi:MAG: glucose-6-phosphate isomerase [Prolixibacteraceae bacterium]|jgi:glucose-6-phosphate isomerase|nr:glucose-6-phosphate isomerase [Prolixibacteraceae bacterium]
MKNISLNLKNVYGFVPKAKIDGFKLQSEAANLALHKKTGKGNDFLGWVDLPGSISEIELSDIEKTVQKLQVKHLEVFVVIGIGGSYLGSKAVIDALSDSFAAIKGSFEAPLIVFAGQNISEDYLFELRDLLDTKDWACTVISKSGTTTEPALAFRILKQDLEEKYGIDEARKRIIAVTDAERGALRKLAKEEGYKTFVIPDDVGGRYSVLTPVGLIAIGMAGFNIRELVKGAIDMEKACDSSVPYEQNLASQYAAARNALYQSGKKIEILVNYNPKLHFFAEWWKQLYGESEGKDNKGIYPSSVDFSSDLHSMGQYIQEGERTLFETVLSIEEVDNELFVPEDEADLDGLNFLAGKRVDEVNKMAELGTAIAHVDGGVPNIRISVPKLNEYYLGQLIYFFEIACGISGYILDVNPFDQPGVESYKKNMFALLNKPGFEKESKAIQERLK